MIIVVMGVAGSGKSTVGALLAQSLGVRFVDGDHLHPPANVDKMRRGVPLDDHDRAPWLAAMAQAVAGWLRDGDDVVLAASLLTADYRRRVLVDPARVRLVHLTGSRALLEARLAERRGHFLPPSLLDSQLGMLEPDDDAIAVDIDRTPAEIVAQIRGALEASAAGGGSRFGSRGK
jgi:gluconokinase